MKQILSILIVSILIFQSGVNSIFVFKYYQSYEKYKADCVNKDKPQMKCHGSCKMKKETNQFGFNEKEDKNDNSAPVLKSIKLSELYIEHSNSICLTQFPVNTPLIFTLKSFYSDLKINIPHPPPELV